VTNALVYYDTELIMFVKSFILQDCKQSWRLPK
jgi:hypothetical protein